MWQFKAGEEGSLIFEIQDKEGQIVQLIVIDNLTPLEDLFVEVFEGQMRNIV